jgi:hypothetical protein
VGNDCHARALAGRYLVFPRQAYRQVVFGLIKLIRTDLTPSVPPRDLAESAGHIETSGKWGKLASRMYSTAGQLLGRTAVGPSSELNLSVAFGESDAHARAVPLARQGSSLMHTRAPGTVARLWVGLASGPVRDDAAMANYLALGDSISIDDYTGVPVGGAASQLARKLGFLPHRPHTRRQHDAGRELGLSRPATVELRRRLNALNGGIAKLARERGLLLADLERLCHGHGLASDEPWFVQVIEPNLAAATAIAEHWHELLSS